MRELSLNILDLVQNSIAANAKLIKISIIETDKPSKLTIKIEDDGCGMTDDQAKRVTDPFYTTRKTRKVGMGIPLFKMAAEMTGGNFSIKSKLNVGTCIIAEFNTESIDMIPIGDINSTILLLIKCNAKLDFIYNRIINGKHFTFDTREVRKVLDDIPLDNPDVLSWISDYLKD